jgi:hypothetical protein
VVIVILTNLGPARVALSLRSRASQEATLRLVYHHTSLSVQTLGSTLVDVVVALASVVVDVVVGEVLEAGEALDAVGSRVRMDTMDGVDITDAMSIMGIMDLAAHSTMLLGLRRRSRTVRITPSALLILTNRRFLHHFPLLRSPHHLAMKTTILKCPVQRMWPQIAAMARDLAISMLIPERRGRGVDEAAVGVGDIAGGRSWGMSTVMVTVMVILIVFMMATTDVMGDTGITDTTIMASDTNTVDDGKARKRTKAAPAPPAAPAPAPVAPAVVGATMRVQKLGRSVGRGVRRCVRSARRSVGRGVRGKEDMGKMVIGCIGIALVVVVNAVMCILEGMDGMKAPMEDITGTRDTMANTHTPAKDTTAVIKMTTRTTTIVSQAANMLAHMRLRRAVRSVSSHSIYNLDSC